MTRQWFDQQMARLCGLRFAPSETDTHWEALCDLPDAVLQSAVTRAQKTRVNFPTPVELRQDADQVATPVAPPEDRSMSLLQPFTITVPRAGTVVSVTREWKYYDDRCSDLGWVSCWCGPIETRRVAWMELSRCERRGDHDPHEWVSRCPCTESNPALVRKRNAVRKYAEKEKGVRR